MQQIDHNRNIIEIDNVSFSYGNTIVLEDINLNIHLGDFLAIVGPNGGGKTTLLKIVLGLLKPTKGTVRLFGTDIKQFKDWTKVGYVPQKVTNFDLNFPATVREVVAMGRFAKRGLFRFLNQIDDRIISRSLEHVDMLEYQNRLIGSLSGGQQQRVFIARALAQEPSVILLDEPTVGIDVKAQEDFYALMKTLNEKLELSLAMVSHDLDVVAHEATEVACINRILACHVDPKEFFRGGFLEKVYGQNAKYLTHHH